MVQAIINISEHSNQILNIIKAKHGLKDKSQAIDVMAEKYGENLLEPQLRPEYVEKALAIHAQPSINIGTLENLKKGHA